MPRCPFATWKPISGSSGTYTGGPFKIVHHTTEGSSAAGAFAAFKANRSDPHFTVDATTIYQHIDTDTASRALKNLADGVQTNRDSAIQIEVVGFAHRPKIRATLDNVRRLCRWLEATHSIPKVWPNGLPKPAVNGQDPGGHNRNASIWDTKGGHYGHSNVPENTHWDPAYTKPEVDYLMLEDTEGPEVVEGLETIPFSDPGLESDHSHMPDHADPQGTHTELPARRPARARAKPAAKAPSRPKKTVKFDESPVGTVKVARAAAGTKKAPRTPVRDKAPRKID